MGMMVSMGDGDVDKILSEAASWGVCAHTLQVKRKRKEIKILSLIVVVCFVSSTMRGERKSFQLKLPDRLRVALDSRDAKTLAKAVGSCTSQPYRLYLAEFLAYIAGNHPSRIFPKKAI